MHWSLQTHVEPGGNISWLDLEKWSVPEPAVSVPRAKLTRPAPTAAPDPEEDPPGMNLPCAY